MPPPEPVCHGGASQRRRRHVRLGSRRAHVLQRREGREINAKKTYPVYKALGMQLPSSEPMNASASRERANTETMRKAKLREDRKEAVHANDV